MALFVGAMVYFWPGVPWNALRNTALIAAVLAPIAAFPFTKTFYLAVDLCFRPPEPPDLATPIERGFLSPRPTDPTGSATR